MAAALLVKQGYNVIGGFIKNWSDTKDVWTGECEWRGDRRDAMRVAAKLGIPLLTFDFEDAYRRDVVDTLFQGYAEGTTPNPDVLCNQFIKFGLFFEEMKRLKADFVATGHYARVRHGRTFPWGGSEARLFRGRDPGKDQSYFLHRVHQEALRHTLFPVGDLRKPQVREIARDLGLPTAEKKESMGICFIGKQDMNAFLRTRIASKPGDVVDANGVVIGSHKGLDSVTIGQRHGFALTAPSSDTPWYAAAKDVSANCLVAVPGREHPLLYKKMATVMDLHWVAGRPPRSSFGLSAMVRYRQEAVACRIGQEKDGLAVHFSKPVFALAPGQSCVFYRGHECLGGGIIR
ncbi:MAG: tRNA-specific 2-thiouridylase MnmA [Candidatus Parcubacteria bacterium]